MEANANSDLSTTIAPTAAAPLEDLPVVEVFSTSDGVVVKWGEEETTATHSTLYSAAPYSFSAMKIDGKLPFIKTFGSLLHCDGGTLTIGATSYRIQVQQQQQSGDPGYPFNDSIYILYSKTDENGIVVIATAFAVTKMLAFTAGHTISSKNEKGQTLLIDEPLFLTTVLVRNDDVIAPEEGKVVIPVTVQKFHYENYWAVLERNDGGIFPQMIPVATSVQEVPRDGARNELTFYHCPVALFRDDEEYTDRLHVTPKVGAVGLIKKNSIDFQNGGFDGSCEGPYVYMGKAIAIHTLSHNSALTAEALRVHQCERAKTNKRMKIADVVTAADSCAASHTSVGTGILIYKRDGLVRCIRDSI